MEVKLVEALFKLKNSDVTAEVCAEVGRKTVIFRDKQNKLLLVTSYAELEALVSYIDNMS